jgi:heme A synthase
MSVTALAGLGGLQILLGLGVIIWHVPIFLALAHQAVALAIFAFALFVYYQLRHF